MSLVLLFLLIFLDWFRYVLVKAFFVKSTKTNNIENKNNNLVAILQPILSGDSELANNLLENLRIEHKCSVEWIWLVDKTDLEGQKICRQIAKSYPAKRTKLVLCSNAPKRSNPKVFKLDIGLKKTKAKYVVVLDDDTMVSNKVVLRSVYLLEQKRADLVFGLPFYISNSNVWSRLISAFVNSNSLLSYIPYTFFFKPITINGMYYMTSRKILKDQNVFKKIENQLCDDFAIAEYFNNMNLRLLQTNLLHPLSAKTESFAHFHRLLHRWFLFPIVSFIPKMSFGKSLAFLFLVMLPVLSSWISLIILVLGFKIANVVAVVLLITTKSIVFVSLSGKYLGKTGSVLLMFAVQFIVPIYILYALFGPRKITWRGKKIKVLPSNKIKITS